jgi:predicted Co/Zn/Cd cation transporter (cation efflux family)
LRRAVGIGLLLLGVLLVVFGVSVAFGDAYDTGRALLVGFGVFYAAVGAGVGALGWLLVRRR